jgi:hypothetical protein
MQPNVRALGAAALILSLSPLLASADPLASGSPFPGGHVYQIYTAAGIDWCAANDQANAMVLHVNGQDIHGHLATLTSKPEDDFVEALRGNVGELWVGGYQTPIVCPWSVVSPPTMPAGSGWTWVNGEGAFAGDNHSLTYANWHTGEPNDNNNTEERYLGIGLQGSDWNDEAALGNIAGFVVEYDVPLNATDCAGANGCQTNADQTITLPTPPSNGSTIGVETFGFTDPRICGSGPLSLFNGALVIPSYLCGSPDFLVVKTEPNFDVPSGTVEIENNFINNANECSSPIGNSAQQAAQQAIQQAVVVWQANDPSQMHETSHPPTSGYLGVGGYAGEFTDGCGSSRGSVRGGSFHVIGMHIGFSPDPSDVDPAFVLGGYIALTSYKLQLLQAAVESAKNDGAITKAQYNQLSAKSNDAPKLFGRGLYGPTLNALNQMEDEIERMNIAATCSDPNKLCNHEGDLVMRVRNLIFTIEAKVVPLSQ